MDGESLIQALRRAKQIFDTEQEFSFSLPPDVAADAVREFYDGGDRLGMSALYEAFCEMLATSRGMSQAESILAGGAQLDSICLMVDSFLETGNKPLSLALMRDGYKHLKHTIPGPVRSFYREAVHYRPIQLLQPPIH